MTTSTIPTLRRFLLLAVAAAAFGAAPALAEEVNGTLRDQGDHKVLRVWGTHEEMGYAHGYLLAEEVMALANGYVLPMFGVSAGEYEMIKSAFIEMLEFPDEVVEETEGIIAGIEAAGVSLEMTEVERDIDVYDLLLSNSAADLFGIHFCSSISAWGAATEDDDTLDGELAIVRDLDWGYAGGEADLREYAVILVRDPSDPAMQPWVSIGFPGWVGCLSCFNVTGIGAFQNQGNTPTLLGEIATDPAPMPIHMTMRQGGEHRELDGDGQETIHDVEHAVATAGRLGTYEIHVVSRWETTTPPAFVIEADNGGMVTRLPTDDPLPAPDCIAVTNHHRMLTDPITCDRYATIQTLVDDYAGQMTLDRMWEIETAAGWNSFGSGTIHTMRYVPALGTLDVAFADHDEMAPLNPITSYDIDALFEGTLVDDGEDDAADDDDSGEDGEGTDGCGCSSSPAPAAVPAALAARLGLFIARRRS